MSEENKLIARRCWAELRSSHAPSVLDLDLLDELVAHDYLRHEPNGAIVITGIDGFRGMLDGAHVSMPDVSFAIEDQIAEGDKVATRWKATATHANAWRGVPATGKRFSFTGITVSRIADGKIAEEWVQLDTIGPLEQLRGAG